MIKVYAAAIDLGPPLADFHLNALTISSIKLLNCPVKSCSLACACAALLCASETLPLPDGLPSALRFLLKRICPGFPQSYLALKSSKTCWTLGPRKSQLHSRTSDDPSALALSMYSCPSCCSFQLFDSMAKLLAI